MLRIFRPLRRLFHRGRAFRSDTAGAVAVIAAILFPVVVGGMGLAAETGYWYLKQRKLQHAADTSAHAAGVRQRAGDTMSGIRAAASHVASQSGFPADGTLTVNAPPASGAYTASSGTVEVILEEVRPRLFSAIFSDEPVRIGARAVARVTGGSTACVLALSPARSGAVTVSGSAEVDLTNCGVASNSNATDSFLMSGTSSGLTADCVSTVGGAVTTGGLHLTQCPAVRQNAPVTLDPYASVEQPAVWGGCNSGNIGRPNRATTVTASDQHPIGVRSMRFCGGLDLKGTVTFDPGLYIVDGGSFTVNGGGGSSSDVRILGEGVTFLLVNGAVARLAGNASLNLTAPAEGPLSGIAIFGSRSDRDLSHQVAGTLDSVVQGALYTPTSDLSFRGNSATTDGCTQVIADRVTFTGNSITESSCQRAGAREIVTGQVVTLVE